MAPSRHDWKIVDWDLKPQHKQIETTIEFKLDFGDYIFFTGILSFTQLLNSNVSNHHFYSKQARKKPTENI